MLRRLTPATNAERVQMFVGPSHDYLDEMVQLPERQGIPFDFDATLWDSCPSGLRRDKFFRLRSW